MFKSFFPKPGPFFLSAFIWALIAAMRVSHAPPPASQNTTAISAQINADRKKGPGFGKV
jgi:ABC-type long-subunit fatty acid transport system fused permease/ATPase subunit